MRIFYYSLICNILNLSSGCKRNCQTPMKMSATLGPLKIIKQKNAVNTGTVIFFHGSGDTGGGILDWVKFLIGDFTSPHLKFLFPTAPLRPYKPLNGEMSHVWFDRYDIVPTVPEHQETLASIDVQIKRLIDGEVANGTALNKIIVGGFSMGGALALHTAYRNVPGLAGAFALSSFLNNESSVYEALQSPSECHATPFIMFHGDHDTLVPSAWGEATYKGLKKQGVNGEFHMTSQKQSSPSYDGKKSFDDFLETTVFTFSILQC
ncbi:hypothetical protein Trydic_g411 [Trypoxylus dichotomus]